MFSGPKSEVRSSQFALRHVSVTAIDVGEMFICSKLKIVAKSFGNGSQDICKCYESNSGCVIGFEGGNYPEESFFTLYVMFAMVAAGFAPW